jgi:hypothetical protein
MRQYRNFRMANQKAINVAFNENGREIWYSRFDVIDTPGLSWFRSRGAWAGEPLPETYLK